MRGNTIAYKAVGRRCGGWTTGSCAAAAAQAAALLLLTGQAPAVIRLETPGSVVSLPAEGPHLEGGAAVCTVRKDAGDDPDVTNGVRISAAVRAAGGVTIDGGAGVGRVTKPGLSVPVGEAAINPGPRAQIAAAVAGAAREAGYAGGFSVILSRKAARRRTDLQQASGQVVGGISILGNERHRGTHERKGAG